MISIAASIGYEFLFSNPTLPTVSTRASEHYRQIRSNTIKCPIAYNFHVPIRSTYSRCNYIIPIPFSRDYTRELCTPTISVFRSLGVFICLSPYIYLFSFLLQHEDHNIVAHSQLVNRRQRVRSLAACDLDEKQTTCQRYTHR